MAPVITLWPPGGEDGPDLAAAYAYPDELAAPFVRVNFVASVDGAVSVDGRSRGLQTPADQEIFRLLRRLCDVVLVGAGTARAEDYGGARKPGHAGVAPPPIAVVTGSADLDPASRLFTDTTVAPIVLTTAAAPEQRLAAIADAGADVALLDGLTPAHLLAELDRRGLHRVLCEGGPGLFGDLVAGGAVDELCLTVAPIAAGGTAGRISRGPAGAPPQQLDLAGAIRDHDGTLLLRYRRADRPNG
ncbi:pyrimidine reductase family protein [Pseudonocardia sp. CA-107938]|uniref:pyrimidine reductase family protein n=1 Tax=Pseudonocardia sp. CA-107938 TaxID=3240021 RepID=UPI003D8D3368